MASEPEALLATLTNSGYHFKRIGLEAGPLSQWLFSALAEAGLPVICVETRHMRAVLQAQINKTDRNDARGIAQMMRAGLYRPVHVKTLRSQKLRMLLTIASCCRGRLSPSERICADSLTVGFLDVRFTPNSGHSAVQLGMSAKCHSGRRFKPHVGFSTDRGDNTFESR